MPEKKKTQTQVEDQLRKARSTIRNLNAKSKAYREGLEEGMKIQREANRNG